jgi:hypothetical protein
MKKKFAVPYYPVSVVYIDLLSAKLVQAQKTGTLCIVTGCRISQAC